MRDPFSIQVYRAINRRFIEPIVLPRVVSRSRLERGFFEVTKGARELPPKKDAKRIWFHAASAGELEALWSVILEMCAPSVELVLTVMSQSGEKSLSLLREACVRKGARVLYAGFSPWDGSWGVAIRATQPDLFVTAKYEAWPELWFSLRKSDIPLVILGGVARKSLRVVKQVFQAFRFPLPKIFFTTAHKGESEALLDLFPDSDVESLGDPRWDRVKARLENKNTRVSEIEGFFREFKDLSKVCGVLGSIWPEDIDFLRPFLKCTRSFLFFVPHQNEEGQIRALESALSKIGFSTLRSSRLTEKKEFPSQGKKGMIVDEMGFLSELYGVGDWAYVGGGFGKGVHSTIEPAIWGIKTFCGPNGSEKASEVAELSESSQLTVLRDVRDLLKWEASFSKVESKKNQVDWIEDGKARLGASERIRKKLLKIMNKSC